MRIAQDPITKLWCREDGAICMPPTKRQFTKFRWTVGSPNGKLGYLAVRHKRKPHYAHRIIASAFLCNPSNLPTVDHIDRDPTNNNVGNLRWASYKTQAENHGKALNRADYGVRWCENKNAYARAHNKVYEAAQKAKGLVQRKCPDGKKRWIMQENTQIGGM